MEQSKPKKRQMFPRCRGEIALTVVLFAWVSMFLLLTPLAVILAAVALVYSILALIHDHPVNCNRPAAIASFILSLSVYAFLLAGPLLRAIFPR